MLLPASTCASSGAAATVSGATDAAEATLSAARIVAELSSDAGDMAVLGCSVWGIAAATARMCSSSNASWRLHDETRDDA